MTPEQKPLARHALGLPNRVKTSYRNRFYAGAMDAPEWRAMVAAGLANSEPVSHTSIPDYTFFWLTPEGATAALEKGEKLCAEDFPGVAA